MALLIRDQATRLNRQKIFFNPTPSSTKKEKQNHGKSSLMWEGGFGRTFPFPPHVPRILSDLDCWVVLFFSHTLSRSLSLCPPSPSSPHPPSSQTPFGRNTGKSIERKDGEVLLNQLPSNMIGISCARGAKWVSAPSKDHYLFAFSQVNATKIGSQSGRVQEASCPGKTVWVTILAII